MAGYFEKRCPGECNTKRKEDIVNIEENASVKYRIFDDVKDIDKL